MVSDPVPSCSKDPSRSGPNPHDQQVALASFAARPTLPCTLPATQPTANIPLSHTTLNTDRLGTRSHRILTPNIPSHPKPLSISLSVSSPTRPTIPLRSSCPLEWVMAGAALRPPLLPAPTPPSPPLLPIFISHIVHYTVTRACARTWEA